MSPKRWTFRLAFLGLLTVAPVALDAQVPELPRWNLTAAFTGLRVGQREGWGYGPTLGIRRDIGDHWGIRLNASLPAFGTGVGGGAVDLGATFSDRGERYEVGGGAGGTAFLVGGGSELVGGGIGVYSGAHATAWLDRTVGATVAADIRFTFIDHLRGFPSVSGGLSLRF